VRLRHELAGSALAMQLRHDSDGFNRWFAADALARRLFAQALTTGQPDAALLATWTGSLDAILCDPQVDPALIAEILTVADAGSLGDGLADIDPEAVHQARAKVETALAIALADPLLETWRRLDAGDGTDLAAQACRRLRNTCLAALCRADRRHLELARKQHAHARNLTDRLATLGVLLSQRAEGAEAALADFAQAHAGDVLVLDKWFALQATVADPATLLRVEALTAHRAFRWTNPNNVHALLTAFAQRNPRAFHRADGAAYRFIADAILKLDGLTPQVAARIATAFGRWRTYEPLRRALMRRELERLAARAGRSSDLADIVERSLAD
jgi:aminopeptidase N